MARRGRPPKYNPIENLTKRQLNRYYYYKRKGLSHQRAVEKTLR
jgi:hypothetical protein